MSDSVYDPDPATVPVKLQPNPAIREGFEAWARMRCPLELLLDWKGDGYRHQAANITWHAWMAAWSQGLSHGIALGLKDRQWIPVSERLPEKGTVAWTWGPCGDVLAEWTGEEWDSVHCDMETGEPWLKGSDAPTHWMPIPEPPA